MEFDEQSTLQTRTMCQLCCRELVFTLHWRWTALSTLLINNWRTFLRFQILTFEILCENAERVDKLRELLAGWNSMCTSEYYHCIFRWCQSKNDLKSVTPCNLSVTPMTFRHNKINDLIYGANRLNVIPHKIHQGSLTEIFKSMWFMLMNYLGQLGELEYIVINVELA